MEIQQLEPGLDRKAAAAFLKNQGYPVEPTTLAKLASVGGGPVFEKFGRKPLYTKPNLIAWVRSKLSGPLRSTSDSPADQPPQAA